MKNIYFNMMILAMMPFILINAQQKEVSPADNLPPYIKRITQFGERADWSHDGKKILFIEKTYGDAYEVELATGEITLITGHFYHGGFTRALYLVNGDVLLSGCTSFDASNPNVNRQIKAELWVLDKSYSKPPVRLETKCSEGPAVSRKNMKIAWTVMFRQYPDNLKRGQYLFYMADIIYENDKPKLVNKKMILDNLQTVGKEGEIETQNFVLPDEKALTFSTYAYLGGEVMLLDIETGNITRMTSGDERFEECEGIFPDGKSTCIERGSIPGTADIWQLKLDGSGEAKRLTYFNDYKGYRASNPSISDDGKFMAFQLARTGDRAGVGYGIFIMDLEKAEESK